MPAGGEARPAPGGFFARRPLPSDMAERSDPEDEDGEWRFSLSDLEDEGEDSTGSVAGSLGPAGAVEPGDVDLENALFVALGVLAAGLVVLGFVVAAV